MFKKSSLNRMIPVFLVTAIVLSACGQAAQPPTPVPGISVGIILPDKTVPIWTQVEDGFNDAFETDGYSVQALYTVTGKEASGGLVFESEVYQGGNGVDRAERNNVYDLIGQGVKVIIIRSFERADPASDAMIARNSGVKVIALDQIISNTDAVDYYVAFDPFLVGKLEGQYLVDKATGSGNPLYLYCALPSTDYYTTLVFAGAWSVLQPRIADGTFVIKNSSEAVNVQNKVSLDRDEWIRIMDQIGAAHPDSQGSFTLRDFYGLVLTNLAEATITDKGNMFILAPDDFTAGNVAGYLSSDNDVNNYILTGAGAETYSVQAIIDGKQSMTVLLDERMLIGDAVTAAEYYLQDKTPPSNTTYNNGNIDVPATLSGSLTVVDRSNVMSALIDSGYYKSSDFTGLP